jgi:hypothetical protein
MTPKQIQIGFILPLLMIIILSYFFDMQKTDKITSETLNKLPNISDGSYTFYTFDPITFNISMNLALKGTLHENKWQLNKPYKENWLNIYIIDSKSMTESKKEMEGIYNVCRNNAVYLDDLKTIILDYQLIEILTARYFSETGILGIDTSKNEWGQRGYMVDWIISHEIGHFVKGHKTSHFSPENFLAFPKLYQKEKKYELEADAYFAQRIEDYGYIDPVAKENMIDSYISVLLNILIKEKNHYKNRNNLIDKMITFLSFRKYHPEYIERAFNLLKLLSENSYDTELQEELKQISRGLGFD